MALQQTYEPSPWDPIADQVRLFEETGLWFGMLVRTIAWTFRPPFEGIEWLRQMVRVGVDSIPVVFLTTMFTGMVMALQTYNGFHRVHAENCTLGRIEDRGAQERAEDATVGDRERAAA